MIADLAARQECGEVTVQNVVTPSTAASTAISSDVNATDEDAGAEKVSGNDVGSHNSNSAGVTDFGQLVCRKRKAPAAHVHVVGPEIEMASLNGTEHTHSGAGEDGQGDVHVAKKARPSLDSVPLDSSPLQCDDTAAKVLSNTDTGHGNGSTVVKPPSLITETADSTNIIIKNDFGSEVLKVSFTDDMWSRLLVPPIITPDMLSAEGHADAERASYGVKYNFSLKDKAAEAAVDAPEWLVPQVSSLFPLSTEHEYSTALLDGLNEDQRKAVMSPINQMLDFLIQCTLLLLVAGRAPKGLSSETRNEHSERTKLPRLNSRFRERKQ